MKLKYYLRGLGIGILVTVILCAISSGSKKTMTDEEVMARAKELGMVESMFLTDMAATPTPVPAVTDVPTAAPNKSPEETGKVTEPSTVPTTEPSVAPTEEPTATPTTEPMETPKPTATSEPTKTPEPEATPSVTATPGEPTPEPEAKVTITIERGASSGTVSRMLADAGLVESASSYDKYLCEGGYDKKIRVGVYEIAQGATENEIARIITGIR